MIRPEIHTTTETEEKTLDQPIVVLGDDFTVVVPRHGTYRYRGRVTLFPENHWRASAEELASRLRQGFSTSLKPPPWKPNGYGDIWIILDADTWMPCVITDAGILIAKTCLVNPRHQWVPRTPVVDLSPLEEECEFWDGCGLEDLGRRAAKFTLRKYATAQHQSGCAR